MSFISLSWLLQNGCYLDGAGPALAVGEVPEELADAVPAEGAGEDGVLHLLVAEDGHGGVAEAADVHRLLQVELRRALAPHPAPALGCRSVVLVYLQHVTKR